MRQICSFAFSVEEEVNQLKYLINWRLMLSQEQLNMISLQPGVLDAGTAYLEKLMSKGKILEAYRIVPAQELTHCPRRLMPVEGQAFDPPAGVAIVEAKSIEDAKGLIEDMSGATPEGISFVSYLDYTIHPLVDIKKTISESKKFKKMEVRKGDSVQCRR